MNLSFYTAAVGAQQQQRRLDIQGNNIANLNTYGFKAEKPAFSSLLYGAFPGAGDGALLRGVGSAMSMAQTDFHSGAFVETGRVQDYAIQGDGFFALQDPGSGAFSYTRDGSFTLAPFRQRSDTGEIETVYYLSDGAGRYVLSDTGGRIQVSDPQAVQPVGVYDFINTDGMRHLDGGRFASAEKNGQVLRGSGRVVSGMLEASNADLAYELSKVIEAQRSFSYALRMVQTSDEIETTVNGLRA